MTATLQKELLQQIETALKARNFETIEPKELFVPIAYTLSLGGKRVRPLLACLSARLFSSDLSSVLPVATALEVFHNFTLLHDDLMDHSPIRRGQQTVYLKWSENTAILSGDAMCIEAYRCLEGIKDSAVLFKVLPIFNQMAIDICKGQQYDMDFEERSDVSVDEYVEMIRLKTAVLLGASMRLGALSVGASDEVVLALDQVGQSLGLAFQIQDDYLDVYGDEQTFGKPIGGDIMNAKKTLLLLYTKSKLDEEGLKRLEELMSLDEAHREERISGVRELYTQTFADDYAKKEIYRLTEEARQTLEGLGFEEDLLQPFYELFDKLTKRLS